MNQNVGALLRERKRKYFARGIAFAVASGICYGLYTGFLTLGETQGVWGEWFAGSEWGEGNPALGTFTIVFALAALAAGINDLASAIWSLIVCAKNRQLGDLWKTMKTRPGLVMMLCAAIGGAFCHDSLRYCAQFRYGGRQPRGHRSHRCAELRDWRHPRQDSLQAGSEDP